MTNNFRKYGESPFEIAVIHGGPGAPGEMKPVARELAASRGVLEPLQTKDSLNGQVTELLAVLQDQAKLPVVLIGWSWGAMLSFIFAARYPALVKKLALIGCPPFTDKYAVDIMKTRFNRLDNEEKIEAIALLKALNDTETSSKKEVQDTYLAQFGKLMFKSDSYDPLPYKDEVLEYRYDILGKVWQQASDLRTSGELLELGKKIKCPVAAIHGDYDPHPWQGVQEPLTAILKDFRFILLENCGHCPWQEKKARDKFYSVLKQEIEV